MRLSGTPNNLAGKMTNLREINNNNVSQEVPEIKKKSIATLDSFGEDCSARSVLCRTFREIYEILNNN